MAIRYKDSEIAYVSTNEGISDVCFCGEANPIVSSIKDKSIDGENCSVSKHISSDEDSDNSSVSSIAVKNIDRMNYLAGK